MANRFDQPAQAQFVNTYVPIPFEELSQAAMMRQTKHDENLARVDAARNAADNLVAIPNSKDEERVNALRTNLDEISSDFVGQDLSDPEVYNQLRRKLRTAANPNEINAIRQSYEGWQNYRQMEAQMKAKGQNVYNPYDFQEYDSYSNGVFTGLPTMDLGAQAEDAIGKFLSKPEMKYREVQLPSGRLGIEHYRDVNEIGSLIESEGGELLNNPAIQQLMEREGLDEEGFKQALRERAPSYVGAKLSSVTEGGGGGRDPLAGGGGTPVSNWRGADYEGTSLEAIKRDVADSEADIASQERRGREVPAIEKNKLAEQKGVLEEAEVVKRDYVKENTAVLLDSLYDSLSDLSGDAKAMFKKHIELNLDKPLVKSSPVPGSPMGRDNTNYGSTVDNPGAFQLSLDLSESDLSGKEKRKILKAYSKYFDEKATVQNEAEQREEEYAKESLSTLFQTRYNLPAQYFEDDGVLQYEIQTVDASGDPKAIKQQSVIDRIFKDIPMQMDTNAYKIEVPKEGPNKADNLLKKVNEGSLGFSPRTSGINWTLGGEYGSDIVFETGLFEMKDGKPTSVKESDVKLYINDPTMKDAVIAELVNMGERNAAYYLSPWAYSINHRVKNAEYTEDPTQRIDLVGEGDVYAVVTKKSPQHYDVTWFDRDNKPRGTKQDVRGINAVSNFLNSEVFKIVEHEFHKFGWAN